MAGGLLLGWYAWGRSPGVTGGGPVVLISIDTLRADRLPTYGYDRVSTPAIDALAADGVVFERAYAHSPLTLPSHASIFSGRLPFEHGVRDNLGFSIRPDERLLPVILREQGFATAGVISAYVLRRDTGIGRGFDFFDDRLPTGSPQLSVAQLQRDGMESLEVLEAWIETNQSSRFFAFLHLFEPHSPYSPPERYAQYDPYDGEIAYADEIVGTLASSLYRRGLYDQALIVLLSDHGEGLGDHGEQEHGIFLYDEIVRVPLIIKLPAGRSAGKRIAQSVQHIDLLPTLLDVLDVTPPEGLRGRSLYPLLTGARQQPPETSIYAETLYPRYHFGWSELYALTDGRYRFIKAPQPELYDLRNDPRERQNIAVDRPQAVAGMRVALDALLQGTGIEAPAAGPDVGDARARLQALGYVGMRADVPATIPGEQLPDPKDKIEVLEQLRRATALMAERDFEAAVVLFDAITRAEPGMADVWAQFGVVLTASGRTDRALRAIQESVRLRPSDAIGLTNVASLLLKLGRLEEAVQHGELALSVAPPADDAARASAHGLLARIALARNDSDGALWHARLAEQSDPSLPMEAFVRGRILHSKNRHAEAFGFFEHALRQAASRVLAVPELHYYAADTLAQLERHEAAEAQFREEIRLFPQNLRARASLAMLYRATGRDEDADGTLDRLLQVAPTPEGYDLAARVWEIVGEPGRARAVRAEAGRRFSDHDRDR
jgi:arylsulfatase A-like enzyme/Flp pilus assembly protein TadD